VPIHQGQGTNLSNRILAETGGTESVTLTTNQIPVHNHAFLCTTDSGSVVSPDGSTPGSGTAVTIYRPTPPAIPMATSISTVGGSQPHDNLQPYICMNYIISLFGIFPQPN
jgi:microcystin-dependent protein